MAFSMFLVMAVVQSMAFIAIYQFDFANFSWAMATITLAALLPIVPQLVLPIQPQLRLQRRLYLWLGGCTLVLALLAFYVGTLILPSEFRINHKPGWLFVPSAYVLMLLAVALAPAIVQWQRPDYPSVLRLIYQMVILTGLAYVLILPVSIVIAILISILDAVGIGTLHRYLSVAEEPIAIQLALYLFQHRWKLPEKWGALLTTGPNAWAMIAVGLALIVVDVVLSNSAPSLFFLIIFSFCLYCVNSYYSAANSQALLGFSVVALGCSIIVASSLWQRISLAGLTVDRLWALYLWAIFTMFFCGYWYMHYVKRATWEDALAKINIGMAGVITITLLAINSPVSEFHGMAANSQIKRVQPDTSSLASAVDDFRKNLGTPGYQRLQEYRQDSLKANPQQAQMLAEMIQQFYFGTSLESVPNQVLDPALADQLRLQQLQANTVFTPTANAFDDTLKIAVAQKFIPSYQLQFHTKDTRLISADFDNDGQDEFVSIKIKRQSQYFLIVDLWEEDRYGHWQSTTIAEQRIEDLQLLDLRLLPMKIDQNALQIGAHVFLIEA